MKHLPFDATISALDAETPVLGAVTSARRSCGVSGDICTYAEFPVILVLALSFR